MTKLYLASAGNESFNMESFKYVREVHQAMESVLEFETDIDGIWVNGIDMITWNEAGKIVDFKVMIRPLKAVEIVRMKMVESLELLSKIHKLNKRILLFLLVGVTIYLAESVFNADHSDNDIYISDRQINNLINSWNAQVGRNPNADELINLINNLIEEEILYREALKLGLEQDDEIIRRRLAQKIIFLKRDAETFTPSDEDLKNFFVQNQSNYVSEDVYTFEHYFFGNDSGAREEAEKLLVNYYLAKSLKWGCLFILAIPSLAILCKK